MKTMNRWNRLLAMTTSALLGGWVGVLLGAFGCAISDSGETMVGTVVAGAALGTWCGGWRGAVWGAATGLLLVSFGSLIGSSALGLSTTAAACAGLGAWLRRWADERDAERQSHPVFTRSDDGPVDLDPCVGGFGPGDARPHVRLCSRV